MYVRLFCIRCGSSGLGAGVLDRLRVFWSGRGCSRSGSGCSGHGVGVLEWMQVF